MNNRKNTNRGFWSTADTFNIVDTLSIFFATMYLIIVVAIILNPDKPNLLLLQDKMNIPMMTILGGYFGDQIATRMKGGNVLESRFKEITISESPEDPITEDALGGYADEFDNYIKL